MGELAQALVTMRKLRRCWYVLVCAHHHHPGCLAKLMNLFFYVFILRIVCATLWGRLGGAGLSGPVLADAAVALSKLPELDTLEYVGLPRAVVYLLVHEMLSTLPRPP